MANEKRTFGSDVAALVADREGAAQRAAERQAFISSQEQRDLRAEIIKAAYTASKADYTLKAKIFVYYVQQVKAHGITLDVILPNFVQEIKDAFRSKALKALATDENTKEALDEDVVIRNVKRMFKLAAERYDVARGADKKGPDDQTDSPLATIRTTFEQSSLENIADAFALVKKEERKVKIIREMFQKLTTDAKEALLLELEAIAERDA